MLTFSMSQVLFRSGVYLNDKIGLRSTLEANLRRIIDFVLELRIEDQVDDHGCL